MMMTIKKPNQIQVRFKIIIYLTILTSLTIITLQSILNVVNCFHLGNPIQLFDTLIHQNQIIKPQIQVMRMIIIHQLILMIHYSTLTHLKINYLIHLIYPMMNLPPLTHISHLNLKPLIQSHPNLVVNTNSMVVEDLMQVVN